MSNLPDCTDRTLTFRVRTTAYGSQTLFAALSRWIALGEDQYRRIDLFEQRVDNVDMELQDEHTKEFQRTESPSYGGSD